MVSASEFMLVRDCWISVHKPVCRQTCTEKGQVKQIWSRSSSESLQTTHVRGHWTPSSCSLRLVGITFLHMRKIRFFILGGVFKRHIPYQKPSRRRWEESVRTSTHSLYALLTE
jgi:hypothetical protein